MKIKTQIILYKDYLDYKKSYKENTDDNWDMKITFASLPSKVSSQLDTSLFVILGILIFIIYTL